MQTVGQGIVDLTENEVGAKRLVDILMDSGMSLAEAVEDVRGTVGHMCPDERFWSWLLD